MSIMTSLFMHPANILEECWFPALKIDIGINTISVHAAPEGFDCCGVFLLLVMPQKLHRISTALSFPLLLERARERRFKNDNDVQTLYNH
jgi:hypothetical protein